METTEMLGQIFASGIAFAILAAICLGLYILPSKGRRKETSRLQFGAQLAFAYGICSTIAYVVHVSYGGTELLSDRILWLSALGGVFWAMALWLLIQSIDAIGLARSNQWKNLQGPVGVILSLCVLGEFQTVNPWLAMAAGILIFLSAALFSIPTDNAPDATIGVRDLYGIGLAIGAGICFGANVPINRYVAQNSGVYNQQLVQSWSSFLVLACLLKVTATGQSPSKLLDKNARRGLCSGVLYLCASLFMLLSFARLEVSIAFTIIQLNFLLVVAAGILVYKEFELAGNILRVGVGLLLAIFGVLLLACA